MKQLKKNSSKVVAFLLAIAMVATSLAYTPNSADAASKKKKKTKVSKVQITKPSTKVLVLKKGKTYKMKVKVTASKKKYKKVTYKSSKKKVATVSKSGKIKARKKGTTKITVTSKTNKKKKATLTVKVGTPITKVTLTGTHGEKSFYYEEVTNQDTTSPDYGKKSKVRKSKVTQKRVFTKKKSASVTITEGEYVTLKANYTPKKATYRKVSYKSSNKKVATVDSTGFILGKAEGTATITATAKDGSGKKAKVKVTVKKFVEVTTPAPTAVPDNRKTTTVENFESYAVGTNWDKYTTGGQANPGTMTVVADPLDPNNKVLKVDYNGPDQAYDFAPYFNVDLATIPNAKEKLGNYVAMKFKVRVVSNTADCQYKQISGFFADYGTINRDMANSCSYAADHAEVVANPAKFKFLQSLPGMLGVKEEVAGSVNSNMMNDNRYMPQYNNDFWGMDDNENQTMDQTKRMEGFAGYLSATNYTEKAEYSIKTLDFDRTSVNCKPYLDKSKFDMTFGSTYKGQLAAGEKMEYYIDDIELVEGEVATIPATSVTVDPSEKEMEVGDKLQLTTTVLPENTTDAIEYSSSDEKVATVAVNGMVTAVSEGAVTITAKANDNAKATCQITVKAASKEEIITDTPTAGDAIGGGGTVTDDGILLDATASNYASMNVTIPDNVNLANCKSIKFTFALSDANEGDTVKLTMAVIHKDATSNYDENMTDPVHGRITETYSDVAYGAADQQDNITYDAATGLYTTTYSLVGKSGLENAKYLMLQRNGGESAPFKLTLKTVEYTVKAAGVEEKDILDDFKVEYPITDITKLGWSNWDTETNNYATLTEKGCTIADDGEVTVPAAQWDGIAIPLDNIKGTEAKDYYVEATVKSATDAAVMVGFSGSNTLSDKSAYYPGNAMKQWGNDYYVQRAVKGWQTIKAKITVPAGKFGETRLKGTEDAGFVVKSIKVEPYTDQDLTLDNTLVLLSLPSEKTVAVGNSITLKPVASPAEADISSAVWASDNEAVATVSGGAVTAVAEGEANVSVTVGEVKATCKVTVTKEVVVAKDIKVVPSVDNAEVLYSKGTVAASGSGIEVTFNKGTGYPECVVTLAEPVDVSLYEKVIGPNGYNLKLYKEDGKSSVDYYTDNGTAVFADKADSWADGDKVAKIGIQLGKDKDSNTEDTTLLLEKLTIVAK